MVTNEVKQHSDSPLACELAGKKLDTWPMPMPDGEGEPNAAAQYITFGMGWGCEAVIVFHGIIGYETRAERSSQGRIMKHIIATSILLLCAFAAPGAESIEPDRQHRLPTAAEAAPYIASINAAIQEKLVYPRDHAGKRCTAHVEQEQTGKVVRIRIKECASEQLHRAVERAILLASPLPLPEGDMLFNRHLVLEFIVPTQT